MFGELEVEAALDTSATNDGRPAEGSIGEMIVARNRQDAEFVIENTVQNIDYASSDTVIGSAFLLDDVISFVGHKVRNTNTGRPLLSKE